MVFYQEELKKNVNYFVKCLELAKNIGQQKKLPYFLVPENLPVLLDWKAWRQWLNTQYRSEMATLFNNTKGEEILSRLMKERKKTNQTRFLSP